MPRTRTQTKKEKEKENEESLTNNKSNYSTDDKKNKYGKKKWDDYIQDSKGEDNINLKKLKDDKNIIFNPKILEELNITEDNLSNKINYININYNITDNSKNTNNLNDYKNDIKLNNKSENLSEIRYQNENKNKNKNKKKKQLEDDEDDLNEKDYKGN